MKINGGNSGPVRPDAARNERGSVADKTQQSGSTSASRLDSVEISDAGRAKSAGSAATRSPRLQEIRDRILRGAYDTDEVVAEVARRILDRGDLQPAPSTETQ
jgi:anti-sigma28 factor (negative regulator of flagellin synthesis)